MQLGKRRRRWRITWSGTRRCSGMRWRRDCVGCCCCCCTGTRHALHRIPHLSNACVCRVAEVSNNKLLAGIQWRRRAGG